MDSQRYKESHDALVRMMRWLEEGLPDIDTFDVEAQKLCKLHDRYYGKFLDKHNAVYGTGIGPLGPRWYGKIPTRWVCSVHERGVLE